jgi:hypothetical protein
MNPEQVRQEQTKHLDANRDVEINPAWLLALNEFRAAAAESRRRRAANPAASNGCDPPDEDVQKASEESGSLPSERRARR